MIVFGALIWGQATLKRYHVELGRVQSLGLRMMGHFRRGTPNHGLFAITGVIPLHLFIQGEIIKANLRWAHKLRVYSRGWDGKPVNKKAAQMGHIRFSNKLVAEFGLGDIRKDFFPKMDMPDRKFKVIQEAFTQGRDLPNTTGTRVYTDGSRLDDGRTGIGICILSDYRRKQYNAFFPTTEGADVFQTELLAITKSVELLLSYWGDYPPPLIGR
jgi:hypothetical protein